MRRILGFAVLVVALAGCSSSSPASGDDDDDGTGPAASIEIEQFEVPALTDHIYCKTMKMPGEGTYDVTRMKITMVEGSHHFILYRSGSDLPDGFGDCTEMNDRNFVTGSQTPGTYETNFPAGKAMPLFGGEQLILESHYANASTEPITGGVEVEFFTSPHDEIDAYLETALLVYDDFEIPPSTNGYADGTQYPEVPGLNVWMMSSHTHKRMTLFEGFEVPDSGGATKIYENTDWHAPYQKIFDPPLVGKANTSLGWTCTWNNETTNPIYFGPTTEDEMCILVVTFWPSLQHQL